MEIKTDLPAIWTKIRTSLPINKDDSSKKSPYELGLSIKSTLDSTPRKVPSYEPGCGSGSVHCPCPDPTRPDPGGSGTVHCPR